MLGLTKSRSCLQGISQAVYQVLEKLHELIRGVFNGFHMIVGFTVNLLVGHSGFRDSGLRGVVCGSTKLGMCGL